MNAAKSPALRGPSNARFLVLWFLLGNLIALGALALQLTDPGSDLSDVLRVGIDSPAGPFIESELGPVRMTNGQGHDGQYSYLIARDPLDLDGLARLADDGGYRFRRALYGWLAGGFGLLPPREALIGLAFWSILGVGLASAALADIASSLGTATWVVGGVIANIGLWLSVQLATADALAMGLALLGVSLMLRRRETAAAWVMAAAVLTKDSYLLFPLALGGWMVAALGFRRAIAFVLPSLGALISWALWLQLRTGDGFSLKGNLGVPLRGLMQALPWSSGPDLVLGAIALLGLALSVTGVFLTRDRMLGWLAIPWILTAILSSSLVWQEGNNAARALAANWTLGFLMLGYRLTSGREAAQSEAE